MILLFTGCYTAIITPLKRNFEVDYDGLKNLVDFQVKERAAGILAVGTSGESPTLTWDEHEAVIEKIHEYCGDKCLTIAGTGSNSTEEAMEATEHAESMGVNAILLVDPYYNGPSSMEIRKEYIEPIARKFPEMQIISYIIPGRTGTQLLPQDLALLYSKFPNVRAVKDATGNMENAQLIRKLCGPGFEILSGDDDKTFEMMTSKVISANGVVSVTSNIAPKAVSELVKASREKNLKTAEKLNRALRPLFEIVTVKTIEKTSQGTVPCKARNPLPYKTLMNILGIPSGPCRRPLGKMTKKGLQVLLDQTRKVYKSNPEILEPLESFFDVKLERRLFNKKYLEGLFYDSY